MPAGQGPTEGAERGPKTGFPYPPFLAEFKYDGQRAQIHLFSDDSGRETVRIFSRNSEDKTDMFPDVAAAIRAAARPAGSAADANPSSAGSEGGEGGGGAAGGGGGDLVFDAELVAVDRADGNRIRDFNELATRQRGAVEAAAVSVQVCVFVFDCLYAGGRSLTALPLRERRAAMLAALPSRAPGVVEIADSEVFDSELFDSELFDSEAAESLLSGESPSAKPPVAASAAAASQAAVAAGPLEGARALAGRAGLNTEPAAGGAGDAALAAEAAADAVEGRLRGVLTRALAARCEGLMLKPLEAPYEASKRSIHWLKLKKDYCPDLQESLDLVPIGAWRGNGRKAQWYSPFLLAAYDPDTEEYSSVCRCMSGFTDAFYQRITSEWAPSALPRDQKPPRYNTRESPDFWFPPTAVWELRGASLSLSPTHMAGIGLVGEEGSAAAGRGLSVRFPRFVRGRPDRLPETATTGEQLAEMYMKQQQRGGGGRAGGGGGGGGGADGKGGEDGDDGDGSSGRDPPELVHRRIHSSFAAEKKAGGLGLADGGEEGGDAEGGACAETERVPASAQRDG